MNLHSTWQQLTRRGWLLLLLVAVTCAGGCVALHSDRDALAQYQRTREEMARAAEGVSYASFAEKDASRPVKKPLAETEPAAPSGWKNAFSRLFGRGPSPTEAEQLYQQALARYQEAIQLRQQNQLEAASTTFLSAGKLFSQAAKKYPQSSVEQNSLYYAGECYFFADYYPKANESYEKLLKQHPNSRHLDEVQKRRFAIAQYWLDTYQKERPGFYSVNLTDESEPWNGLFTNSMRVFDRIRLDDPTGKLADDATLALANAYFAEGKFSKADEYYTDLRKTFPSSEHQFTAHFVGLKAKLLTYQGPDYGGAVLEECEKLIYALRKQFPNESEEERDYLVRALAEVRFKKAEREFLTAQYFETKAEYGAAKHYYNIVLTDFGDTPFATQTRERVASIQGLPDVPPQRFEWLASAFPKEETARPLIATDKPKTKKR